jgi:hypothetical protein
LNINYEKNNPSDEEENINSRKKYTRNFIILILFSKYYSFDEIMTMRWAEHVASVAARENT